MKKKDSFLDNLIGFLQIVLGGFGFCAVMAFFLAYTPSGGQREGNGLFWKNFKEGSIIFIIGIACYLLWYVFHGYPQAKEKEQQKEQYEQQKVIVWKCEYCGEEWRRRNEQGKPYPHSIGRCSRAPGAEHVLYESESFMSDLEFQERIEWQLLALEKQQMLDPTLADPEKYGDPEEWGV